jgi:hypothetical protein
MAGSISEVPDFDPVHCLLRAASLSMSEHSPSALPKSDGINDIHAALRLCQSPDSLLMTLNTPPDRSIPRLVIGGSSNSFIVMARYLIT